MTAKPARQALFLLRILVVGLTVLFLVVWLILTLWLNPWFLFGGIAALLSGTAITTWYLPRYLAACTIFCRENRLCIRRGVWWQREQHLPLTALRTFAWWDGPLSRHVGCRTLWVRYAGGFAFFPPLSTETADHLHKLLTEKTV